MQISVINFLASGQISIPSPHALEKHRNQFQDVVIHLAPYAPPRDYPPPALTQPIQVGPAQRSRTQPQTGGDWEGFPEEEVSAET